MKRQLNAFWRIVNALIAASIVLLAAKQIFIDQIGFIILENTYLYLILGLALAQVFISKTAFKKSSSAVAWYDLVLSGASLFSCLYFAYHGQDITLGGWMFASPSETVTCLSVALCILILEALRRSTGVPLLAICTFFVFYPSFAGKLPGILEGQGFGLLETFTFHALSTQSIVGLPIKVVAELLLGYMVFGVVLADMGGGKFFLDFAMAALGRFRGGAAKVAVLASSFFGSMSGSSISNVIATGTITIPAMKKSGFAPNYAGAVEACASTGGTLMPPIMGAAAFLMASFLNISYASVAISAFVPSFLYYFGLLIQVDSYAARHNIHGLSRSEIPSLKTVMKQGWQYLIVLLILIYILYLRLEDQAPFYAMLFLLIVDMARKETRLNIKAIVVLFNSIANLVGSLAVTIGAVGFIMGALSLTGVGATLSGELVHLAGDSLIMMLIMGAVASFVLGMGMPTSACYIFLSIVLAPGLVNKGLNPLAVHLFILYWAIISNITLPVALAVMPAANIAGASYYKTGFTAMQFGFVTYFVPFLFVLSPAMILQGPLHEILYAIATSFVGVFLMAEGIGAYLVGVGKLSVAPSAVFVVLGFLLASPWGGMAMNAVAMIASVVMILGLYIKKLKMRTACL